MGGTFNIVTGIPFSATFNNGTNTFTVPGDYTSMFNANAILTVLGGSPNGGYRQVVSSSFGGGNTTVTSTSYSTGTAYPGPTNFTTGTGSVLWFLPGTTSTTTDVVIQPSGNSNGSLYIPPYGNGSIANGDTNGYADGTGWTSNGCGGIISGDVFGNTVNAIAYQGQGSGTSDVIYVVLTGTLAQNAFSSMSFTDTSPALETYNSNAAVLFDNTTYPGYTIWGWTPTYTYPFGFSNITITFTA